MVSRYGSYLKLADLLDKVLDLSDKEAQVGAFNNFLKVNFSKVVITYLELSDLVAYSLAN